MFQFSVISFVLLVGQLGDSTEIVDAVNNSLIDSGYSNDTINPEEMGSHFEGDILIPKEGLMMRNGLTSQSSRWPNGIVPYVIGNNFKPRELYHIYNAFNEFHRYTCIRFVSRTTEQDYISIENDNSGCYSYVGRIGGKQVVNLQTPECLIKPGTAMHEYMHTLGFFHEQNREDRDSFVSIQYENIEPRAKNWFNKEPNTFAFGIPYDYGSVMHYHGKAFSKNGQPTIIPKKKMGNTQIGQRVRLSASDIKKLNKMYNCGKIG